MYIFVFMTMACIRGACTIHLNKIITVYSGAVVSRVETRSRLDPYDSLAPLSCMQYSLVTPQEQQKSSLKTQRCVHLYKLMYHYKLHVCIKLLNG